MVHSVSRALFIDLMVAVAVNNNNLMSCRALTHLLLLLTAAFCLLQSTITEMHQLLKGIRQSGAGIITANTQQLQQQQKQQKPFGTGINPVDVLKLMD